MLVYFNKTCKNSFKKMQYFKPFPQSSFYYYSGYAKKTWITTLAGKWRAPSIKIG